MKKIGLIGGTSWESTVTYYQLINTLTNKKLGGNHSARCILYSVDFNDIEANICTNQWDNISDILIEAAVTLEKAGVDFLIMCTNTLHKLVPEIERNIHIPILHVVDATSTKILEKDIKKVGLLGTKPTMTQDFYKKKLFENGIDVLIPNPDDIDIIDSIIFDELCHGIIKEESKNEYLRIVNDLHGSGAQGIVFGCTEIGMLIKNEDIIIPVFDTALIHATAAVEKALEN